MTLERTISLASKSVLAGLAAMATSAAPAQTPAQTPAQSWLDNRFVVNLGGFVIGTDVSARLDGDAQAGDEIDFDEQFRIGNSATRWRADALWRITPRHQMRLGYFSIRNSGSSVLDRDIEWGGYTFIAGASTAARLEADIYLLDYEFAFIRRPTYEVAGMLGVHFSDVSLSLSGQATLVDADGNVIEEQRATKTATTPMPLPLLDLRGVWVVSPRVVLGASAAYFKASFGSYNGYWSDLQFNATWMYSEHFGLAVGYNRFRSDVDMERKSFNGSLQFGYSGLQFFVTGTS